ncbi:MAG: hypothetical protein IJL89_03100, partial [Firmicutes bacterium]|nr:hypothetical protein [Bacillota bacterium]
EPLSKCAKLFLVSLNQCFLKIIEINIIDNIFKPNQYDRGAYNEIFGKIRTVSGEYSYGA